MEVSDIRRKVGVVGRLRSPVEREVAAIVAGNLSSSVGREVVVVAGTLSSPVEREVVVTVGTLSSPVEREVAVVAGNLRSPVKGEVEVGVVVGKLQSSRETVGVGELQIPVVRKLEVSADRRIGRHARHVNANGRREVVVVVGKLQSPVERNTSWIKRSEVGVETETRV